MSCDWNIRCVDCDVVARFNDANHQVEMMQVLIRHRAAVAALAPLLRASRDFTLHTYYGDVDADFFEAHHTHRLVPHDEYGRDLDQCGAYVMCQHCQLQGRRCTLPLDHPGSCTWVAS